MNAWDGQACYRCGQLFGPDDSVMSDGSSYRHMNGDCPKRPLYVSARIYNQLRTKGSIRLAD